MDWDIDVDGVNQVLSATATAAEPFEALGISYGDSLGATIEGLNYDVFSVVAVAVAEYAEHWSPIVEAAARQVSASMYGTVNAVTAYMEGQETMAETAQRQASLGIVEIPGSTVPDPNGGDTAV
ncbi:DUF6507 family protein [Kribbella sp. HUAS MG21]|uniref:DUF6507 family protein n=1 Tax=Kribbella sp. HUAS MG21 TaxID=3160966 RepID=A0AAU7T8W6_9ACTN